MISTLMVSLVATLISYAQPQAVQRNVELSLLQTKCLTEAIYFESRSEGTVGGAAVSYVILNRSALEDKTICQVVHEKSQFSFYSPHERFHIRELGAWKKSADIAIGTQLGTVQNPIGNATLYNTVPVRSWRHVVFVKKIKHEYFYQLPSTRDIAPLVSSPEITNAVYIPPSTTYTPAPQWPILETKLSDYTDRIITHRPMHDRRIYHPRSRYLRRYASHPQHHWLQVQKAQNATLVRAKYGGRIGRIAQHERYKT